METVVKGTLVADRYRLIREIGFGGMGTVWLAHDSELDSQCAVKLIGACQAKSEEFLARFECEAKCAAQLRCAHVVGVLNRGLWQGKPFIVMEYMGGEDLAVRLERLGRLDARTTYRIVAQVARALMRAHVLGIVHRDIKPGNIFLVPGDDHEVAKVLDFGVAQHRGLPNAFDSLVGGQFVGTPCYMSPEQASGRPVDARSDLWALAVVAYECMTGEVPFQDESVVDLIEAISHGKVPRLTENRPELPAELESWWRRATAREPGARFQSAKELADAFAEAVGVYPMPISGFPCPSAEAATLSARLPSRAAPLRPARAVHTSDSRRALGNHLYQTDAAVTMHAEERSSSTRFAADLRGGWRRAPYVLVGAGLCSALLLATGAWRPALGGIAAGFGLSAPAAPPPPQLAGVSQGVALSPISLRSTSADAELRGLGLPLNAPEPTLRLEPEAPVTDADVPVKKPNAAVRAPNRWRPLAPPAPPASRGDKDYGI